MSFFFVALLLLLLLLLLFLSLCRITYSLKISFGIRTKYSCITFLKKKKKSDGVGRVDWALSLKVPVLDSIRCAPQFESCYLYFEKIFLSQRFIPSWAHSARTVISFQLKVLRKHCGKLKKQKKKVYYYFNININSNIGH